LLAVVATIHFIDMVLDTRKTYLDAVIVEKRKAITANGLRIGLVSHTYMQIKINGLLNQYAVSGSYFYGKEI